MAASHLAHDKIKDHGEIASVELKPLDAFLTEVPPGALKALPLTLHDVNSTPVESKAGTALLLPRSPSIGAQHPLQNSCRPASYPASRTPGSQGAWAFNSIDEEVEKFMILPSVPSRVPQERVKAVERIKECHAQVS
jgi:hypothetical protein